MSDWVFDLIEKDLAKDDLDPEEREYLLTLYNGAPEEGKEVVYE